MASKAPHLHQALRCFCLGAFRLLTLDVEEGEEVPFAFEEHGSPGRPPLYEYRPLVRPYVEARSERLFALRDTRIALDELGREPAAAIFARAHADVDLSEDHALFRAVLLPMLCSAAEACGGFDWDDVAVDRAYGDFERSLFGKERTYGAVAPLVGLSAGTTIELGQGLRVRRAVAGETTVHWPEAKNLMPTRFGREPDRLCVLELERGLSGAETPDAPGEIADAVTAIRLATAGAVAAGPIVFERLDWRPLGIRAVLPIAAAEPRGEEIRLDVVRGALAHELLARLARAEDDPELAEALDRWELSLFQAEPARSDQLRESIGALLGGSDGLWAAAVRGATLLGESGRERAEALARLRALAHGEPASPGAADAVRRSLVEVLLHGDRLRLLAALDEALLGVRPRPAGYYAARSALAG